MKKIYVEIADDFSKRAKGLMFRKQLPFNKGMLFKYPVAEKLSFWMANTYVPLDIAFLEDDGKIFQIESMAPLSTRSICSLKPCKYALEVNHGWFQKNNVKEGDVVGGYGISFLQRKAQLQENAEENAEYQIFSPDVELNMSFKEQLERANVKGDDVVIIYRTKSGKILPPKSISPPFDFEATEDGKKEAIVKAWDNQMAGWKSFIIDNIISLEKNKGI